MKKVMFFAVLAVASGFLTESKAATDCDRACLKELTDRYFQALAAHDPSKLPLAANVKFTENGAQRKLGEGFWKTAGSATFRMDIFDPVNGDAGVHAVVLENNEPVMLALRLKVKERKITEVETVLAHKGSTGVLWAPQNLSEPHPNFMLSIRPAEQNSRFELMATADAYWRAFETQGTPDYRPAPLLPSTNRYENGLRTTNVNLGNMMGSGSTAAEQFDRAMFKGNRVFDRRYPVVDVERGIVMSFARFDSSGLPPSATENPMLKGNPLTTGAPLVVESFAVQAGKIMEILVVLAPLPFDAPSGW